MSFGATECACKNHIGLGTYKKNEVYCEISVCCKVVYSKGHIDLI